MIQEIAREEMVQVPKEYQTVTVNWSRIVGGTSKGIEGEECMRNPVDSHSTIMSLYNSS